MSVLDKSKPIYLVQAEVTPGRHLCLPFGIMFVGKALARAGWRVRLFHLCSGEEQQLFDAINDEKPLFLGVSSQIGSMVKWLIMVSKRAHRMGVPVVWGGPFASMVPKLVLGEDYVKYVVLGEGEKNTPLLADAIAAGEKPKGVPGVGWSEGEEVHMEPPAEIETDLDQFEPGWELVPLEKYYGHLMGRKEKFFHIPFSRGCPFNCGFCYNRIFPSQKRWRSHSPEYYRAQLEYLNKHLPEPMDALSLIGDNALGRPEKGKELIQGLGMPWSGVLRIELVDEDFVRWAGETGCLYIGFGFETASDRLQKVYDRHNTAEQFRRGVELFRGSGTMVSLGVMFFGPTETLQERRETIELIEELYLLNDNLICAANAFFPQPGTTLWSRCIEEGFNPPADLEEWSVRYIDFMRVHGWTPRKWARVYTTFQMLYGSPLSLNTLKPGRRRSRLYKRLWDFSFRLPVEEAVRARARIASRIRRPG